MTEEKETKETEPIKRGPKPDLLKIEGDWEDAVRRSFLKKPPAKAELTDQNK